MVVPLSIHSAQEPSGPIRGLREEDRLRNDGEVDQLINKFDKKDYIEFRPEGKLAYEGNYKKNEARKMLPSKRS